VWSLWKNGCKTLLPLSGRVVLQQVKQHMLVFWQNWFRFFILLHYVTNQFFTILMSLIYKLVNSRVINYNYPFMFCLCLYLFRIIWLLILFVLVFLCRECQVKHWPKHKPACKLMGETMQRLQEELNIRSWIRALLNERDGEI